MMPQNNDAILTALYGIGEHKAEMLIEAGVETCQDMAEADPEYVAEVLETSESEASDFVADAKATVGYW